MVRQGRGSHLNPCLDFAGIRGSNVNPMKANRPHFHVWHLAQSDRAMFRQARAFNTRTSARKYAVRRGEDPARFEVRQCFDPKCAPKLPD